MKTFKPMLAAAMVSPSDHQNEVDKIISCLHFPVLATPKFDGIRCLTLPICHDTFRDNISTPVARSLKLIPNTHVRSQIGMLPPGLDGEIMTYNFGQLFDRRDIPRNFNQIQGDIMAHAGVPNFRYHVFDWNFMNPGQESIPYIDRVESLKHMQLMAEPTWLVRVLPTRCRNFDELSAFMNKCISEGHEGICFRTPSSPYKWGRSTLRQQWLVKWKLFATSEATVVGYTEEMHNTNVATLDAMGHQVRSSHQENMTGKSTLGALIIDGPDWTHLPMEEKPKIGTGFTADQRYSYWLQKESLVGRTVTFKHQQHGAHEAPRIPIFIGFRDPADISE